MQFRYPHEWAQLVREHLDHATALEMDNRRALEDALGQIPLPPPPSHTGDRTKVFASYRSLPSGGFPHYFDYDSVTEQVGTSTFASHSGGGYLGCSSPGIYAVHGSIELANSGYALPTGTLKGSLLEELNLPTWQDQNLVDFSGATILGAPLSQGFTMFCVGLSQFRWKLELHSPSDLQYVGSMELVRII